MSLSELNGYTYSYGGPYLAAVETPNYVNMAHRTNLALGAGGGIECSWKKHFAFRLFQTDCITRDSTANGKAISASVPA